MNFVKIISFGVGVPLFIIFCFAENELGPKDVCCNNCSTIRLQQLLSFQKKSEVLANECVLKIQENRLCGEWGRCSRDKNNQT